MCLKFISFFISFFVSTFISLYHMSALLCLRVECLHCFSLWKLCCVVSQLIWFWIFYENNPLIILCQLMKISVFIPYLISSFYVFNLSFSTLFGLMMYGNLRLIFLIYLIPPLLAWLTAIFWSLYEQYLQFLKYLYRTYIIYHHQLMIWSGN